MLALALVNVVTAGAMYVFFSMRFSRAVRQTVEQSRKNSLLRELKENVELTIEYINSSLDTMDQKTRSFYQLLRRSEELVDQLESLQESARLAQIEQRGLEESAKSPGPRKKTQSRAGAASKKAATAAKGAARKAPGKSRAARADLEAETKSVPETLARPTTRIRKKAAAEMEAAPYEQFDTSIPRTEPGLEDTDRNTYNVDRVLADIGEDRLEISTPSPSVESAYRGGERSRPLAYPEPIAEATAGSGVLGKIGAITRRILGVDAIPNTVVAQPASAPVEPAATRFEIPKLSAEELERPVPGARQRVARPPVPGPAREAVKTQDERAMLPRLDRLELGELPAPARTNPRDRITGAGYGPAFSAQPELPPAATILESEGLSNGINEGEARRADVIRTLLQYGYRPGDISRATGIALPEVELVASLPVSGRRPRRQRLSLSETREGRNAGDDSVPTDRE